MEQWTHPYKLWSNGHILISYLKSVPQSLSIVLINTFQKLTDFKNRIHIELYMHVLGDTNSKRINLMNLAAQFSSQLYK